MSDKSKFAAAGTIRPKVVIERTYRAQAKELWALWTTKRGFESWWGPEGFRVEVHNLPMHDEEFTKMSTMGMSSQLMKLEKRFGGRGPSPSSAVHRS